MNHWYFPCNPKYYRIHDVVREVGYSYWHQDNHKYQVGDVLYIYITGKEGLIKYKAYVSDINLYDFLPGDVDTNTYATHCWEDDTDDEGDDAPTMRIEYVAMAKSDRLTRNWLRSMGHQGFMSPNHFSKVIVAEIEKEF